MEWVSGKFLGNFTARVGPLLPVCMVPDWQLFALNLHVQALVRGWIFGATTATKGVNCQVWEVGVIGAELGASGHGMPLSSSNPQVEDHPRVSAHYLSDKGTRTIQTVLG